jgi:hypothetical protein
MPYRDELVAAVARADAALAELDAERIRHAADRERLAELEQELREFRLGGGRPGSLVLLMLGVEFLAVVAVAVGYLTVR